MWALLALVPLILLYLIRPRPKKMAIPSLMFFMRSSGAKKLTSFLKHMTHDWLFLIQLVALLALALTFSDPFTTYQHDVTAANTVVVLDVSASSQAREGGKTRFEAAVDKAKDVLGAQNSIVLAKDTPFMAVQDAPREEAVKFLNSVQPRETVSRVGEAIILAGEALGGEGRVVVVSDFINTGGQAPDVAKAVLESQGIVVDFINVAGEGGRNVGIIQLDEGNEQTTVYVKNYNANAENVRLTVGSTQAPLTVPAKGVETYTFRTPPGVTKIELGVRDDFPVDNVAFLSAPEAGRARAQLVANNASPFLRNALLASGAFEVVVSEPPVVDGGAFDVFILDGIDTNEVLPGTFEDILEQVEAGATAVVVVQDDSRRINYKGLLPVSLGEWRDGGFVTVEQLNRFTKNIEFGAADRVIEAEASGEQVVVATVNDLPVITMKPVGAGKLVYYGIPESAEFKYSPHYPIFWTELLRFVTSQQDVANLNFEAGETLLLDSEQRVRTPSGAVTRAALVLDKAGIYELEDRVVAVNLEDEVESNINLDVPVGTRSTEYELRPVKETREFQWELWLLAIALAALVFELWFVKWRGDL